MTTPQEDAQAAAAAPEPAPKAPAKAPGTPDAAKAAQDVSEPQARTPAGEPGGGQFSAAEAPPVPRTAATAAPRLELRGGLLFQQFGGQPLADKIARLTN